MGCLIGCIFNGYYQAKIKGDEPFLGALLGKAGASVGYVSGNIIKVPMDKSLNPISKQYEWVQTGVWTITKPAPQNSIPSIAGNIGDSVASGLFGSGMEAAVKDQGEKNEKSRSLILMMYLMCSFFMLLFIMSLLFQTIGYWVNGSCDLISFIRVNMFTYLKMGVVGYFVGFI